MEQRDDSLGLHERRRRKVEDGAVNFSQIRRPGPLVQPDMDRGYSNMTPPETPMSPKEAGNLQCEQQPLFHNYLRAFCHFERPAKVADGEEALLMTVTIRPGDLILVHTVHENGWADGTVLTTGARGWLPTNYCETFDHPLMRNLLNAMTQFWDLLGAGEDANLSTFMRQDYFRGLIAGVRYLLEHADCLHRDATLVQKNSGIRRLRKGLLADLSSLVQIAKRLQETISESFANEVVHVLLDDLVAKAFKVMTRAVGFVDILAQETAGRKHLGTNMLFTSRTMTSPERKTNLAIDTGTSPGANNAFDSAIHFPPTPAQDGPTINAAGLFNDSGLENNDEPRSPVRFRPSSGMRTHRLSLVKTVRSGVGLLASEQLARAHDECISHIGAFIGLYLHSRPSSELVATTERLVRACERLLSVVDKVYSHDSRKRLSVQQARANFQHKLDDLTQSTKDVFKFSEGPDDDVVMLPEQSNRLVNVGTSLIRIVGECVVKTRKLIEQVGDFDLGHGPARGDEKESQTAPGASSVPEQRESTVSRTTPSNEKQNTMMMLPPPPPFLKERATTATGVADLKLSPLSTSGDASPATPSSSTARKSLPPLPRHSTVRALEATVVPDLMTSTIPTRTSSTSPVRKCSIGASTAGSTNTQQGSMRDSGVRVISEFSTRATTPDHSKESYSPDPALLTSFGSLASLRSTATTEEDSAVESQLLQKTYANELTLNKDGQVSGGSLPALVEQLTTHDNAPDPQFLVAFFITFRSFTTPRELSQALIHRFDYIGDSKAVGTPVRLRIYNVFKQWLETCWNVDADKDALGDIRYFALHKLKPVLPQAGERLVELTRKVTAAYSTGALTSPLVSGVGKMSMSIGPQAGNGGSAPEPIITRNQLATLRNDAMSCSIVDFDPLEVARQLTLLAATTFGEIQPEELLNLEWTAKHTSKARNVRNMCILNTDLAHVVGDTILGPDDAKKRALVIKHWSKIATCCLEMNNYESLMAIMCSINSSVVQRLKRTWEVVSKKTKARLDELNSIVDFSRNHASLRRRLEKPVAPCLPFLGIYLTDLTFVDAGNPKTRELPGTASDSGEPISVINFDKHMRVAKIIGHLQKFQVPYKLQEIPEMQSWLQTHLQRMRNGNAAMVGHLHRRSVAIEPKNISTFKSMEIRRHTEPGAHEDRPKTAGSTKTAGSSKTGSSNRMDGQRFEVFMKTNFTFKSRHDLPRPEHLEHR
ncbi:Ras guanine nucleotide exchange factor bud5 [Vermiconidia calcicola]|uniref:Ras guanine nucleotide exchange factor bud5 n=1 Tax=Vermiconidia calcicola TaxID=1690605 RepID=A0ACC3MRK9_9PEZI|nr:Ras guanine nucleotide exchange factor bud5 [Vermiconidia calcicola]